MTKIGENFSEKAKGGGGDANGQTHEVSKGSHKTRVDEIESHKRGRLEGFRISDELTG